MKKKLIWGIAIVINIGLLYFLCNYDLKSTNIKYLKIFWGNLTFVSTTFYALIPFLLLLLILFFLLTRKWAFRVEKLTIGGFNILFDNPEQLFKRQIRSYLNTKRTLFKVDLNHDNIHETLDSYFDVYKILRDEIKILGEAKKRKNNRMSETTQLFELANEMIRELNHFLTTHQSNFRRWYKYMEKSNEEKFFLTPIGELQEEYMNYHQLQVDFEKVNNFFTHKVAPVFEINVEKWGI
jgi:hypothetical protein